MNGFKKKNKIVQETKIHLINSTASINSNPAGRRYHLEHDFAFLIPLFAVRPRLLARAEDPPCDSLGWSELDERRPRSTAPKHAQAL